MERSTCSFHGGPYDECQDDERDWYSQLSVCYPTMQEKAAQRWFEEIHRDKPFHDGSFDRWSEKWSPGFPFHYSDGTTVWISKEELGLGGDFLNRGSAAPEEPDADQD